MDEQVTPPDVYLQALPGQPDLLDLTSLDPNDAQFAYTWLSRLLKQGQTQHTLRPDFSVAETLQRLYFSARNFERVKGLPMLHFAYPLLVWSQGEDRLVAPLFLWQVSLAPAPETPGTWILTHRDTDPVGYNRPLAAFLQETYSVAIESKLADVVQNSKADPEKLVACCTEIAAMLGVENTSQHIALAEQLTINQLEQIWEQGRIQWSGVLGLFPPKAAAPKPTTNTRSWQGAEVQQNHEFGLLPLDPHQAAALHHIFREPSVRVAGAAGTGKTHLLVHLLTNALSNGKRALVIAENVGALRQIQKRLEQLGLLSYSFMLQDGVTEKPMLINLLRTIAHANVSSPGFDENGFRVALDKCKRLKTKLDENYQNLRRDIFGPHNWTETVGLFLHSQRTEGKELLASHLHTQDFKFSYEEFLQLQQGIRLSQPLYQKINTLRHPLSNLHPAIFLKQTQADGYKFVSVHLQTFLSKAQKLHHRYITKMNGYADQLAEQYEGIFGEFFNRLVALKDRIADFVTKYGLDFEQAGAGSLKLKGVFSGKYKSVLEARDEVAGHYLTLVKKFGQQSPFDFQFSPTAEGKNIQKVRQNLATFEKALLRWRDSFPALVQEEIQRLSAKNARVELGLQEQVQELEYGLDQLVEELNTVQLYQEAFDNKMLTIPKRQKYLEEIIEQLENTNLYLREYDIFYDWQRHWLQQPENATKIIRALVKVKPNNWIQAFESWYLHNCLNLHGNAALTMEEKATADFTLVHQQLQKLLPGQMVHACQQERDETLKKLRRTNREGFQQLFDKKAEVPKDKTLPELLAPAMEAVTAVFPILLATPHAAVTALPSAIQVFDYVLFEEAQYLQLEDFLPILPLAKKAIFVEEAGPLPMLQASPVANWASAHQVPTQPLQTCHRSNPGNVLQANNGAVSTGFAVHFTQLDGRYDEATGTNDEEAQHIITLLNEVKPTSQRTFPTVGIVCFTAAQRDLIAAYLLKIKQKWSFGAEKIQQLERNGLGVFYLDELRGQHFEVLIVSGTYGMKNAKGELTSHVTALNNPTFLQHLQLLLSRPLRELFLVNSIPTPTLDHWMQDTANAGYFLLANYWQYNQAPSSSEATRQRVADWLHLNAAEEKAHLFAQEVALSLQPYLGETRTQVGVWQQSLHLPLVVQDAKGQAAWVLQPDGFFATTDATSYTWEQEQRALLEAQGLTYVPMWSVNWWKNPRQETRKLAGIIIKRDTATPNTNGVPVEDAAATQAPLPEPTSGERDRASGE